MGFLLTVVVAAAFPVHKAIGMGAGGAKSTWKNFDQQAHIAAEHGQRVKVISLITPPRSAFSVFRTAASVVTIMVSPGPIHLFEP